MIPSAPGHPNLRLVWQLLIATAINVKARSVKSIFFIFNIWFKQKLTLVGKGTKTFLFGEWWENIY
jgi:hypothetical protein